MVWKDNHPGFKVESAKVKHTNVLSFKLVT